MYEMNGKLTTQGSPHHRLPRPKLGPSLRQQILFMIRDTWRVRTENGIYLIRK